MLRTNDILNALGLFQYYGHENQGFGKDFDEPTIETETEPVAGPDPYANCPIVCPNCSKVKVSPRVKMSPQVAVTIAKLFKLTSKRPKNHEI